MGIPKPYTTLGIQKKEEMKNSIVKFKDLVKADLIIDQIYEGGNAGNAGDDPISKLMPGISNQGGFRYSGNHNSPNYLVLYTSGTHQDWPDYLDVQTGKFIYYGDQRNPGKDIHNTPNKGNKILNLIFKYLEEGEEGRFEMPPIFLFKKHPTSQSNRSVIFQGLLIPGNGNLFDEDDLVAIWRSKSNSRFQNYRALFSVLNLRRIDRKWLLDLKENDQNSTYEPREFSSWKKSGIMKALEAPKTGSKIRTIEEQLPFSKDDQKKLNFIYKKFINNPTSFEPFAADLYKMSSEKHVVINQITRKSRDGGKDAIGMYKLGSINDPIYFEFALEAKCYNPGYEKKINRVGVKEVSRLISRIRHRQFGILVTTSAVSKQAYEEIREDGHPIIIISGRDIIHILKQSGYSNIKKIKQLLENF